METVKLYSYEDGMAIIDADIASRNDFLEYLYAEWDYLSSPEGIAEMEAEKTAAIYKLEAEISALESKKYKRNNTMIFVGDEDNDCTYTSIYKINMARRRNKLKALREELRALKA